MYNCYTPIQQMHKKLPKVSFYGELCAFKIFCKLGLHTTLSAGDVIFSIHTFCKLYIQYNLCGITVSEDGAAENAEVGKNEQLYLCCLLTRLWKEFRALVFIFKVLGLAPHEFGSRASVGLLQEKRAPCEGKDEDSLCRAEILLRGLFMS